MSEELNKEPNELSSNQVLKVVSKTTRKALKDHRAKVSIRGTKDSSSKKYSRKRASRVLYFNNGYDLLQYSIVVRPYIMKKYKIKKSLELEILLYLFPFQYFTARDFRVLLTRNFNYGLTTLIEMGYIEICIEKKSNNLNVYTLTEHSVRIVKEYYQYLSGEKTLNPDSYTNPFRGPESNKADRSREKVMLKLKKQAENWPSLFRTKLFS